MYTTGIAWIAEIRYLQPYAHFQGQIFLKKFLSVQRDHESTTAVVLIYWMTHSIEWSLKKKLYNILKMSVFTNFGHIGHLLGLKMGPIWKFSKFSLNVVIPNPNDFQQGVMTQFLEKSQFLAIFGHLLGPNMGLIWKFSKNFSKLVISIPKPFQRGVVTLYFEKSRFWPILGHIF